MARPPEAWLRGPVDGIPPPLQPVAHAFIAAREDVAAPVSALTGEQLWLRPGGAASVGFHLMHLAGATDRLLTYARGESLSAIQQAALAAERALAEPRPSVDDLLRGWQATVDRALQQLAATPETELQAERRVGRAHLPSTVLGLLFQAAEHATRHVGQIITTARIVAGLRIVLLAMTAGCGDAERAPSGTQPSAGEPGSAMFSESDAYERFMGRWSRRLADRLVEFAGVRDGETVLDVGSGTGSLSAAILQRTTTTRVVGIDPAKEYVAAAARRVGGTRAAFEVGDAQRLRFGDASFDRTLSLLVVNFIPDRDAALREMIRVTRPAGVIAAAVWDYGGRMEMLRIFWDEAVALDPAVEPRDERHMPLSREGELAALWTKQGLREVVGMPLEITQVFSSFDDYWRPFLDGQGPAGAYAAKLAEAPRAALEARLRQRLLRERADGPITLTARAWAVKGVVPAR